MEFKKQEESQVKVREKSRNFDIVSQNKGSATSHVQLDDFSFCQMRCQEVSENYLRLGRIQGKGKLNKSAHPV